MPARESMRALRHQRVSRKTQECDPVCGLGVAIRDAQQSRSAVDRLGAHAITIAACGIESASATRSAMPSSMARSWLSADGKILPAM